MNQLRADDLLVIKKSIINSALHLASINSISYEVICTETSINQVSADLKWAEVGQAYRYSFHEGLPTSKKPFLSEKSFDGTQFCNYFPKDQYLIIKKDPQPFGTELNNLLYITSSYDFLLDRSQANKVSILRLKDLGNEAPQLPARLESAKYMGTCTVNNRNCVSFVFNRCHDKFVNDLLVSYQVFFSSQDDYMPIKWVTRDAKERVISDYTVSTVGKASDQHGTTICFPSHSTINYYALSPTDVFDKPTNTEDFDIKDVAINSLELSDMMLDPSKAKVIFDEKTGKSIQVPR